MSAFRYDHIHLRSLNAVAAAELYERAFGAELVRREGVDRVTRVVVRLGGVTLFIEQADEPINEAAAPPNLGIEHVALAVDDIHQAIDHLRGVGVRVVSDVTSPRPKFKMAFVEGPDRVRFEIVQRS